MSENTQNQCAGCVVAAGAHVPIGGVAQIQEPVTHVQQTAPKVIRLNIGPGAEGCDFKDLHEVTWCDHDATDGSIQYVRADLAGLARIAELEGQLEAIGAGGVESLRQSRQHNLVINEENRQLRLRNAELEARIATQHAITTAAARVGTVYVSGPMTGYADLNFPAFNAEAAKLREQGLKVTNPADHGEVPGAQWADYLRTDVAQLAACERIHLLPGWSKSKGAQLELHLAKALEMQITLAEGAEPLELAAVQQGVQPFGYVNTQTGQFFKDVEPCHRNNEGHWRTVYTHPTQQGLDAEYQRGYQDGYNRRDAEVKGALV